MKQVIGIAAILVGLYMFISYLHQGMVLEQLLDIQKKIANHYGNAIVLRMEIIEEPKDRELRDRFSNNMEAVEKLKVKRKQLCDREGDSWYFPPGDSPCDL